MKTDLFALVSRVRGAANDYLIAELEGRGLRGLAPSHGDILASLFRRGSLSMGELAEAVRRKKNTVTVLVAKLEREGFVRRELDPTDARKTRVALSQKGRALEVPFDEISEGLAARALAGIDAEELEGTRRVLVRMLANLREGPETDPTDKECP